MKSTSSSQDQLPSASTPRKRETLNDSPWTAVLLTQPATAAPRYHAAEAALPVGAGALGTCQLLVVILLPLEEFLGRNQGYFQRTLILCPQHPEGILSVKL
jgi:hypothetical protein